MKFLYRFTGSLILIFNMLLNFSPARAQEVYPCIWRNPERTMVRIFPDAKDYKTLVKKISREQLALIEKQLGAKLLPGQREQFQYFQLIDGKNNLLGYIIPSSQKGKYGAIEFVFGLDKEKKVNGVYIQRAREKDREFRKSEFLNRFIGKGLGDDVSGGSIKAAKTTGTAAVIQGFRKEFITFMELVVKK